MTLLYIHHYFSRFWTRWGNSRGARGGGGGHVSLGPVHHPRFIKTCRKGIFFATRRIAYRVKGIKNRKIWIKGYKIHRSRKRSAETVGNLGAIARCAHTVSCSESCEYCHQLWLFPAQLGLFFTRIGRYSGSAGPGFRFWVQSNKKPACFLRIDPALTWNLEHPFWSFTDIPYTSLVVGTSLTERQQSARSVLCAKFRVLLHASPLRISLAARCCHKSSEFSYMHTAWRKVFLGAEVAILSGKPLNYVITLATISKMATRSGKRLGGKKLHFSDWKCPNMK